MHDLNTGLPASSGWILEEARAINNHGQITGYGLFHDKERAFFADADDTLRGMFPC